MKVIFALIGPIQIKKISILIYNLYRSFSVCMFTQLIGSFVPARNQVIRQRYFEVSLRMRASWSGHFNTLDCTASYTHVCIYVGTLDISILSIELGGNAPCSGAAAVVQHVLEVVDSCADCSAAAPISWL